jgi:hypothetical protein
MHIYISSNGYKKQLVVDDLRSLFERRLLSSSAVCCIQVLFPLAGMSTQLNHNALNLLR